MVYIFPDEQTTIFITSPHSAHIHMMQMSVAPYCQLTQQRHQQSQPSIECTPFVRYGAWSDIGGFIYLIHQKTSIANLLKFLKITHKPSTVLIHRSTRSPIGFSLYRCARARVCVNIWNIQCISWLLSNQPINVPNTPHECVCIHNLSSLLSTINFATTFATRSNCMHTIKMNVIRDLRREKWKHNVNNILDFKFIFHITIRNCMNVIHEMFPFHFRNFLFRWLGFIMKIIVNFSKLLSHFLHRKNLLETIKSRFLFVIKIVDDFADVVFEQFDNEYIRIGNEIFRQTGTASLLMNSILGIFRFPSFPLLFVQYENSLHERISIMESRI